MNLLLPLLHLAIEKIFMSNVKAPFLCIDTTFENRSVAGIDFRMTPINDWGFMRKCMVVILKITCMKNPTIPALGKQKSIKSEGRLKH